MKTFENFSFYLAAFVKCLFLAVVLKGLLWLNGTHGVSWLAVIGLSVVIRFHAWRAEQNLLREVGLVITRVHNGGPDTKWNMRSEEW